MSLPKIRFSLSRTALVVGVCLHETAIYLCPFPGLAIIIERAEPAEKNQP